MSKSLIRKNQLHPDATENILYTTGNQTVNGVKNFLSTPNLSGDPLLRELDLIGLEIYIDDSILISTVRTTGNQTVSGIKNFASRPTVNGTSIFLSGDSLIASNFSSAPLNPLRGQIYFDTVSNNFSGYNGSIWQRLNN